MPRLIDADAIPKYTGYALSADAIAMAVENAPTIDAVEVVRCKDCKHFRINVFGNEIGIGKPYDCLIVGHEMCDAWGDGCKTTPEGFCFMGERREDAD